MTGLGYTLPALAAVLLVCAWELFYLRTGLFRRLAYWLSMLIVLAFQIPVDGVRVGRSATSDDLHRAGAGRAGGNAWH